VPSTSAFDEVERAGGRLASEDRDGVIALAGNVEMSAVRAHRDAGGVGQPSTPPTPSRSTLDEG